MITRRRASATIAFTLCAPALLRGARAQSAWPNRFIRMIVPFPPGGGTDAVGRIMSLKLSELWGQQIVIENRGGAGSTIGSEAVARAEPDGYTILFAALPHALNKFIYPALPFDPVADFAPITQICQFPNLLAVPNVSPARSVAELVALAKAKPGLTFGSSGIGSSPHLSGELFKRLANIDITHVPYRGAGPALNDLIPGRIDMMFNTMGALLPQVRSGQIRGLAVSSPRRSPLAPDFPTVVEGGVPGFDVNAWYALFAPAKTPPEIVRKMSADAGTALRDAGVRQKLEDLGLEVVGSTGDEMAETLRSEMAKWGPIVTSANIKAQ